MSKALPIKIDGQDLTAREGQTILEVARENGIRIPTLCYHPRLRSEGACRVCVVEVEGESTLTSSCDTTVDREGLVVNTQTEKVLEARRLTVELLISNGNHDCPNCASNGRCELQDLVDELGVEHTRFPVKSPAIPFDNSNPMIVRDLDKCVLCGRCVRGCREVQVNNVLDFASEEPKARIVTRGNKDYADSKCVFCGECVQLCPVGAIAEKQRMPLGKAWEEEVVESVCTYCGTGCQVNLHTIEGKLARVTGVERAAVNHGSLCVKGRFGNDFVHHPDRLTVPLVRKGGELQEATWDEALDLVARKFSAIKEKHGADSLAGFTSARCSNEENYLFQKFFRAVVGTQNVDHCARLCHSVTVAGLAAAFGSGAMTNPIADFLKSDVILITGSNPTENHPVIGAHMKRAVTQHGAKVIVVDPRAIEMTQYATVWLRQRPGSDVAWINGLMHVILEEGLYDKAYVEERTEGFEAVREVLKKFTPSYVEEISGIPAEDLIKAARLYGSARSASIAYAMGITQHITGTDNVKSLANLAMLCGNVGIEGGGLNPLRGQNNVQGACDMGGLPNVYTAYQKAGDEAAQKKFTQAWGVSLPDKPGLTMVEVTNAAHEGTIKGLYVMGENPMVSDPDLNHLEESLSKLDLFVVQDIFLTETAQCADVVLPAVTFAEKDGTFTNTARRVQRVRKAVEPPGQAWEDWKILADLATRMGYPMSYGSVEEVFEEIRSLTPSYAGISYARLDKEGGIAWPCPDEAHPGTPILHTEKFARGKGLFHAIDYIPPAELPDKEFPLMLTTGRVLYHYHGASMTGRSEGLVFRFPKGYVEIHPDDAARVGLKDGAEAAVSSRRGSITIPIQITERVDRGTIFIPFHFYETAANRLTHTQLDPSGKIPEFKVCAVRLEPASPKQEAAA